MRCRARTAGFIGSSARLGSQPRAHRGQVNGFLGWPSWGLESMADRLGMPHLSRMSLLTLVTPFTPRTSVMARSMSAWLRTKPLS